jgi:drug/metabolite transporter (DMT)-like permease
MLNDGDRVRWVCPVCSTMNDIEASACRICGTVMATLFAPESGAAPAPKAVGTATALTALLPGAGQAYLGAIATGMARAALYVWTLFIAVLFLVHPPSQSRALMRGIGVLFAAAAASVWGLAFVDTRRAGRGELAPVLDSRTITWTAMGLVVVLFIALTIAAFARR